MFYDRFKQLCDQRGISCNKAALEIGLSNATPTKWKKTGATPSGDTLEKIANYFCTTTDYLTGRTDDPINYDDPEIIANIPSSFIDHFDGDIRRAYNAMLAAEKDSKALSFKEEQQGRNIIRIASRNGDFQERFLSDSQLAAIESILNQLPDASDDL